MVEREKRVAVVTGSGRKRVGNVVAESLARDGFQIAIHYHSSDDAAEETVRELNGLGVEAEKYRADVGNESDVDSMFAHIVERFGRIDLLVNTASIWNTIKLEDVTANDVLDSFRVNALGSFLCAKRAGLQMAQQTSGGLIVNFGDWAVERPYPDHTAYFMAKGAIVTLTRSLAVELAARNARVRVNCIHPGPVMFPPGIPDSEAVELVESTLVKDANCPDVIADTIKFLYGNQFITGVCLPVDGGRTIFAQETRSQ